MTTAPDPFRVLCVISARPNFMKIAKLPQQSGTPGIEPHIVQ
jgi:hypothetical protein